MAMQYELERWIAGVTIRPRLKFLIGGDISEADSVTIRHGLCRDLPRNVDPIGGISISPNPHPHVPCVLWTLH
jgi:hypothetical protein